MAYYDKNKESLRVFYEGEIHDIESGMLGAPVEYFVSGDNVVAYLSGRTKDFKIWYQGELQTIQKYVEDTIAEEIISAHIHEGDSIKLDLDETTNELTVSIEKSEKQTES